MEQKFRINVVEGTKNPNEPHLLFIGESDNEKLANIIAKAIFDNITSNNVLLESNKCTICVEKLDWDNDFNDWNLDLMYNGNVSLIKRNNNWEIHRKN